MVSRDELHDGHEAAAAGAAAVVAPIAETATVETTTVKQRARVLLIMSSPLPWQHP
jgi:hypothetical protein